MSRIAEFADHVIGLVSQETDIPKEQILSRCRATEIVDARHLVIKLLHVNNVYSSRIASIFNLSPRTIHYVLTAFDSRISNNNSLRNIYAELSKKLSRKSETTAK